LSSKDILKLALNLRPEDKLTVVEGLLKIIKIKKEIILTKLLEQAFTKASKLSEEEQNVLARVILEELEAEQKWDTLFEKSSDLLEELANEALKEHKAGKTKQLNPDQL